MRARRDSLKASPQPASQPVIQTFRDVMHGTAVPRLRWRSRDARCSTAIHVRISASTLRTAIQRRFVAELPFFLQHLRCVPRQAECGLRSSSVCS